MGFSEAILIGLSVEWPDSVLSLLHKGCLMLLCLLVSMSVLEHSSVRRFVRSCFAATKKALLKNF